MLCFTPELQVTYGGARLVDIDGVDNAMPVKPSLGSFDRVGSTLALLAILGRT